MRFTQRSISLLTTLIVIGAALAGCSAGTAEPTQTLPLATETASPTPAPRPTLPGDKIDVGGYNLYLDCKGTGSPAVILESGLDGDVVTWKQVHPEVAMFTRVCRYDRAGLAHSDYGPMPRNAKLTAQDLHTLLTKANIVPPYILVGHSFGGFLIRRYAFDYPGEVAGMIFIDSLQEDWWEEALALLPVDSSNDSARLASFRLYLSDGWRDPSNNFEAMDIPAVVEQIRETRDFGDMPITVLTAGKFNVLNPGLPPDLEQALANLFVEQQSRLAALSTNGIQIIIPDAGHNMPREYPSAVVDAIRELVVVK
ncbi:MAG TPA: alpha/beta hydrolase [Anaerolineales bacterium]